MDLDEEPLGSSVASSSTQAAHAKKAVDAAGGLAVDPRDLPPPASRKAIDPQLALELRVRWLEAIVTGLSATGSAKGKETAGSMAAKRGTDNLVRLAENVQAQLDAAVEGNEGIKKFMSHCTVSSYSRSRSVLLNPSV